jgi:hypothetical protein
MIRLTSSVQNNQRPPDWPTAGTTKASEALKWFISEVRFIEEFLVSEIKHT